MTLSPCRKRKAERKRNKKDDHSELLIIGAKVDRKNIGGVGFLVNSTVHHLVDSYKIISPRVAVLRLETKGQGTVSIINGYAPTSTATDEEKEEFYKLFERTVNDEKSYYKVVVGDFYAIVESGVCLTGCKQPEIERSGRVVVPAEKTSSRQKDHPSIKVKSVILL
ncbi:unnamed protein product [Heligmosomoides polygyrus]|uniref:SPOC domain-containing protein n=1 Tax=Heligmosomoides polygyrus TaxID=6339 RepID=A0A183FS82_HELPZ|nr:unnamed protein product [Heligmosomoides polygyrus]